MIADFIRHYPAYTAEAVLRMPARQFLALRCAYAGYPDDDEPEEPDPIVRMEEWREKYSTPKLPKWRQAFDAVHGDGES